MSRVYENLKSHFGKLHCDYVDMFFVVHVDHSQSLGHHAVETVPWAVCRYF